MTTTIAVSKLDDSFVKEARLFWKIIVDPCGASYGLVQPGDDDTDALYIDNLVRKEVGLWIRSHKEEWYRYPWRTFQLSAMITPPPKANNPRIGLEDCQLLLNDEHYLIIVDPGLKVQAGTMGLKLQEELNKTIAVEGIVHNNQIRTYKKIQNALNLHSDDQQFVTIGRRIYYVGENIRLDIEFSADGEGEHALFHHRQYFKEVGPSGAEKALNKPIVVVEQIGKLHQRMAKWQVNQTSVRPKAHSSSYYSVAGVQPHLLTVAQDQNVGSRAAGASKPYFEFMVDAVPIAAPLNDSDTHLFSTAKQLIYAGYSPDLGPKKTLRGSIRRIVFDPNSSCAGCV